MTNTVLNEVQSRDYLRRYSIPMTKYALLRKGDSIEDVTCGMHFPLVMKIVSDKIIHKSDIGGVFLNISDTSEAARTEQLLYQRARSHGITDADIIGISVQEQICGVAEMLIGLKRDPTFGPVIIIGSGGVLVELLQDSALGICPLSEQKASDLLNQIKGAKLLQGFRGRPQGDIPAFVSLVKQVSEMAMAADDWTEIDINPVIVGTTGKGAVAVDARVILK